jgi:hypothetical protein
MQVAAILSTVRVTRRIGSTVQSSPLRAHEDDVPDPASPYYRLASRVLSRRASMLRSYGYTLEDWNRAYELILQRLRQNGPQ